MGGSSKWTKRGNRTVAAITCNSDSFGTQKFPFCILPWHSSSNQVVFRAQKRELWRRASDSSSFWKFRDRNESDIPQLGSLAISKSRDLWRLITASLPLPQKRFCSYSE